MVPDDSIQKVFNKEPRRGGAQVRARRALLAVSAMNLEQFRKNLHRHFRILRGSIDDAWIVMAITEKSFTLRNRATDYCQGCGQGGRLARVADTDRQHKRLAKAVPQ